jgi:hypothetical protein
MSTGQNNLRNWEPLWVVICLIVPAFLFTGCKSDPNDDFIQGIWYYNDEHLRSITGESQQEDKWLFDKKTFQNTACCFAKINMQGKYSILKSEANILELELFDIVGDQGGTMVSKQTTINITIKIDQENNTIEINRSGPYTRMTP